MATNSQKGSSELNRLQLLISQLGDQERKSLSSTMDLAEFRSAFRNGGLRSIMIQGNGMEFIVECQLSSKSAKEPANRLVTTRDRKLRYFRNADAACQVLKRLGVERVELNLRTWNPMKAKSRYRPRPDMAVRLQLAHASGKTGRGKEGDGAGEHPLASIPSMSPTSIGG